MFQFQSTAPRVVLTRSDARNQWALSQEVLGMTNHRELAYSLLRATLGVIFLFAGIGKFMGGLGNFAGGMNQQFSGKLPAALVLPFAYVLPLAEVTLGLLILLGLFTTLALALSGLLFIALTFGTVMLGDFPQSRTIFNTPSLTSSCCG